MSSINTGTSFEIQGEFSNMYEPTKEQKEIAFNIFLRDGWNGGPFTAIWSNESKDCYLNGMIYLDLLFSNAVAIVAKLYGYGVEGYFGTRTAKDETIGAEMMMLDFILLDLADELGYEFVEFMEATSSFAEETKNV